MKQQDQPPPFRPARFLRGGHRQTLASAFPRRTLDLESVDVELEVDADTRIRVRCNWQEDPAARTLVLLHGLTGESAAPYINETAAKALERRVNTVRVDIRNCGGTEDWTPTSYQAGLTQDVRAVLEFVKRERPKTITTLAAWSLGGNMSLKFAGELGHAARRLVHHIVAICPAVELAGTAKFTDAKGPAAIYRRFFLKELRQKVRRKFALDPKRFSVDGLDEVRTIQHFDNLFTAQHWHHKDAAEYYERASALPFIRHIRVPCTLIVSRDDPLIPFEPFTRPEVVKNPMIRVIATKYGGHCAYYGRKNSVDSDRWWVEHRVADLAAGAHVV